MAQIDITKTRVRESLDVSPNYKSYFLEDSSIWVINHKSGLEVIEFDDDGLAELYLTIAQDYAARNVALYLLPYSTSPSDLSIYSILIDIGTRYSGYGILLNEGIDSSGYIPFSAYSGSSVLYPKYLNVNSGIIYPSKIIKLVLKCALPTSYLIENSKLRFKIGVLFEGEMIND